LNMAQAEAAGDTLLADITATIDGIHAAQEQLVNDTSPEATALKEQIAALSSSLQAYNQALAPQDLSQKAKIRLNFDSGKALIDKPGGAVTIEFRCKPGTTDADCGKLTGRVKALFMAVPKNMKHLMKTSHEEHPDGFKRWRIEVKFPFATLDKALTKADMLGEKERAIFAYIKAYLEKAKESEDCVPFHSMVELSWDTALLALFNFFDATGDIRSKIAAAAGPEAQVEKRVANLHAELLNHIEGVDHLRIRTPERSLKVSLIGLPLRDLFSTPQENTIQLDYKPPQEFVGAVGAGMAAGATLLTDMILYQNSHVPEQTVANTTPSSAPYSMAYEDVFIDMEDARIHCWLIPHHENPADKPTVMLFHGNAGDMASRLGLAQSLIGTVGCNVFMVSYRGYGDSTGKPSEQGLNTDAGACWDHLVERSDINSDKILLYGQSLGGAVAIQLAAAKAKGLAAGLIVENTFTSIMDMAGPLASKVHALNSLLPSKWDSKTAIEQVECPILLLSGRKDKLVPPAMMDVLKSTCKGPSSLVEFPEVGHNDTCTAPSYFKTIQSWYEQTFSN